MKVVYPGPDPVTYHPRLGRLVRDKSFDLPRKQAERYIKAGLLRKAGPGRSKR